MKIKKILALSVIVLALFFCISTASAGLFDSPSTEGFQKYTFDGFSLEIPSDAEVSKESEHLDVDGNDVEKLIYDIKPSSSPIFKVIVYKGGFVSSIDEYVSDWETHGGSQNGTYGNWTIIDPNGNTNKSDISNTPHTAEYPADYLYLLAMYTGDKLIVIKCNNLDFLKNVSDTYEETFI